MKRRASYTYCEGPQYSCKYRLERHHFVVVIAALNQLFGKSYRFGLAKIQGGGIEILEWPGKNIGMIKIFCIKSKNIAWPLIKQQSEEEQEWHNSNAVVVNGFEFTTELVALYGAPCWNVQELGKWNKAWSQVGVIVKKHSLYPESKYMSCGEVGEIEAFITTPVKKRIKCIVDNPVPRRIKLRST